MAIHSTDNLRVVIKKAETNFVSAFCYMEIRKYLESESKHLAFIFVEQCAFRIFLRNIFKRKIFGLTRDHYRMFGFF